MLKEITILWIIDWRTTTVVYDHQYFGLGLIPKLKPKLADSFGRYCNLQPFYMYNINEGLGLLKLAETLLILINPSPSSVKIQFSKILSFWQWSKQTLPIH